MDLNLLARKSGACGMGLARTSLAAAGLLALAVALFPVTSPAADVPGRFPTRKLALLKLGSADLHRNIPFCM